MAKNPKTYKASTTCSNCGIQFTISTSETVQPEFCPFCGEDLLVEEDVLDYVTDEDDEEDDYHGDNDSNFIDHDD